MSTGTVSSSNLTSLYSNTASFTTGLVNSSVFSVNGGTGVTVTPTTGNVVVSIGQAVATTSNVTFANVTATGNLSNNYFTLVNSAGTNGQILTTNGAGVTSWTTLSSVGVTSITGTANQVIASSSTGAITLSTPQDIGTTSNVTFGQVTIDSAATINTQTTTTTSTAITTISATSRKTQKVVISITDNVSGDIHVLEALAFQHSTVGYLTTYAEIYSNAALATFTADVSGGEIRIRATPASANSTTFTVARIGTN
jgi:hypothetical protein